jgi:hypothetical protein
MPGDRSVPWVCAALVLASALAAIALSDGPGVFTVDCGAKSLQAQRLLDSGYRAFDLPYPGRRFDPAGRHFPVPAPYAVARGDRFHSQYPVAYAALAAPFAALLGPAGLRLPAALGLAACAGLFAAWLRPAFGRRWALASGLALALATPLAFYGVTVWEHAPTVALALLAQQLAARPGTGRLLGAGAVVGLACWLREELFLVGAALALCVWLARRRPIEVALLAAGAAAPAAALLVFNAHHLGSPLGAHVAGNVGAVHAPSWAGALRDLGAILTGYGAHADEAWLLVALLFACWIGGALAVRRGAGVAAPLAAIAAPSLAAWLVAWLRLAGSAHPVLTLAHGNGFLLRMPAVALAGAGLALVSSRSALAPLRFGTGVGLVFLALGLVFRVLFTDFLPGLHWAPRMLLPALPALGALAVAVLHEACSAGGVASRRVGVAAALAFAIAGLLGSVQALTLLEHMKRDSADLEARVLALEPSVIVTDHVGISQQLPGTWREKTWLLVRGGADLAELARALRRGGVEQVALLTRPHGRAAAPAPPGYGCGPVEQLRPKRVPAVLDFDVRVCRLAAARPER